jgi:hypothetical protein
MLHFRGWRGLLSGGGYLALFALSFALEATTQRLVPVLIGMLLASLAWLINLRRLRAIVDTPTSRVGSAAQGYAELIGQGRPDPQQEVLSPMHRLPCLWYRYKAYTRHGDNWVETERGESDTDFYLDDGTGRCLLRPADAEVLSSRREVYRTGDSKLEEELLLIDTRIYALGEFASLDGQTGFDARSELSDVLSEWKADQDALRQRFDLDHDGRIDAQEWGLARQAARREVESRRDTALAQPVRHVLGRPRHGRPCLIADFPPETLAGRYRRRSLLHAGAALAGLLLLAWLLNPA